MCKFFFDFAEAMAHKFWFTVTCVIMSTEPVLCPRLRTGAGGDPPKGTVLSELVVKFFHGDFTPQGFKRYSGLWSGVTCGTAVEARPANMLGSNIDCESSWALRVDGGTVGQTAFSLCSLQ